MTQFIPVAKIENNIGQIEGLPQNPRFIKDARFQKLKKSIKDDPEMLELRELIVFPHGDRFVVIGGNMRLRAAVELGYTEMPCKVLSVDTPVEKLRAYAIKDNVAFGENDEGLLMEWDEIELEDFGMDFGVETDFVKPTGAVRNVYNPDEVAPDYSAKNKEIDVSEIEDRMIMKFAFTKSEYFGIQERLLEHGDTLEEGLKNLLGYE